MKLSIAAITAAFVTAAVLSGCARGGVTANPSASPSATKAASPTVDAAAEPVAKPTATPNAKITQTEGKLLPGDKLGVEGKTLALSADTMDVSVAGETYHFVLGDKAKSNLGYFNKDPQKPRIMEGTYVIVYYEETDGQKTAQSIEILESN